MPVFLFGCLFSLIWSSAFIAGKVSLDYATPLNFLFFRFVSAGGLLLAACWLLERCRKRHTIPADARMWRIGSLLGLFNYALYLGFSYTGLQTIAPQLVILLVATTPFATSLLAAALNRSRLNLRQLSAIGIGFGGVYFVLSDRLAQAAFATLLHISPGDCAIASAALLPARSPDHQTHPAPAAPAGAAGRAAPAAAAGSHRGAADGAATPMDARTGAQAVADLCNGRSGGNGWCTLGGRRLLIRHEST